MDFKRVTLQEILYERNYSKQGVQEKHADSYYNNYGGTLEKVRRHISKEHAGELAEFFESPEMITRLKSLIMKYINQFYLNVYGSNIEDLTQRIYNDMAGFSILSEYISDLDVEEININSPKDIYVQYSDKKIKLEKSFANSMEATSVIKKMCRLGGIILDGAKPCGDSYIFAGVRVSGVINPCIDEEIGGVASIRRQKPASLNKDTLIEYGTATEDILQMLSIFINNGISVAFAGATSSGKTANMGYILGTVANNIRIITIEDTRELNLIKYDKDGCQLNDVIAWRTKSEPNPVTMEELLKVSLRFHPHIIVPAEMRGKEAQTVIEAGRTGHTIVTSLHANSAINTYDRILTMYLQGEVLLTEERLLKLIVEAIPIVVFTKQLKDGSRKILEIIEAENVIDGEIISRSLYKFEVENVDPSTGKIIGKHQKISGISKRLTEILTIEGISKELINKFAHKGES